MSNELPQTQVNPNKIQQLWIALGVATALAVIFLFLFFVKSNQVSTALDENASLISQNTALTVENLGLQTNLDDVLGAIQLVKEHELNQASSVLSSSENFQLQGSPEPLKESVSIYSTLVREEPILEDDTVILVDKIGAVDRDITLDWGWVLTDMFDNGGGVYELRLADGWIPEMLSGKDISTHDSFANPIREFIFKAQPGQIIILQESEVNRFNDTFIEYYICEYVGDDSCYKNAPRFQIVKINKNHDE